MDEGQVVRKIPPVSRPARTTIEWDASARLAKLTKQPVLAATHVRNTLVKSVRQRQRPPFVTDEGRIIVKLRNSTIEDGVRYGDVYFEWEPNQEESK